MQDASGLLLYLVLFGGIFYFLLYKPQQKQRKQRQELMDSLEVGKNVVTIGGIHGEVESIGDETVNLKIAENVEVVVQKTAIGFIRGETEPINEENDFEEENQADDASEK